MVFPVVMYECEKWTIKKAEHPKMMLLNCGVGEDSWESLGLQGYQPVHPKGHQSWIFIGRTDAEADALSALATWCKELNHWKRPWCWERLKVGREGDNRRWGGWMASPTWCTLSLSKFREWWWTGKPGMLQSMGWQRVRHCWVTELRPLETRSLILQV